MAPVRKSKNTQPKVDRIKSLKPHKAPTSRQLKLTAFFKPGNDSFNTSIGGEIAIKPVENQHLESESESFSNSSILAIDNGEGDKKQNDLVELDDDDDECQTIYCSVKKQNTSITSSGMKPQAPTRKYAEEDFAETFNYEEEKIFDETRSKERRRCPFYKRIPYTKICVDAFNFAKEPNSLKYYFLSHFHADHYIGLTKGFSYPLYCTPVTKRLIIHKFKVASKFIKEYNLGEPFYVDGVRCTFYDANHCPGAAIILFELPNTMRYLHTGDFRACPEMEEIHEIKYSPIDYCFLDTTFCDTTKTFPAQKEVLENTVSICKYALETNPRTLIVCGSYCIGKEKVFMAVAEALNLKVWCNKYKRGYFDCLHDKRLDAVLVDDQKDAKIHVLPLKNLWCRGMREYLDKVNDHFDAIVALRPSGWEYKRNKHMAPETEGNIAIYPVPYSEHSSYNDLERFIKWLRPRKIIPTVNMGDPIKRGQMNLIFKRWLRSPFVADLKKDSVVEPPIQNDAIEGYKLKFDDDEDEKTKIEPTKNDI